MISVTQIAAAMERVLTITAEAIERQTGFVQRQSKLGGSLFAKTMTLGWLKDPDSSLGDLTQVAAALGLEISGQGLSDRFDEDAAAFLKQLLGAAVGELICAEPVAIAALRRFTAVYVDDSTVVALPDALAEVWKGTGERTGHNQAAVKLAVRLDLLSGNLTGPVLADGRGQDRSSPLQTMPLPTGALRVADLGYFSLAVLTQLGAGGSYWLTRLQVQTAVYDTKGHRLNLRQSLAAHADGHVDIPVRLGVRWRLPARLLAQRVPPDVAEERRCKLHAQARHKSQAASHGRLALADWTILVTNAPVELLSLQEALVLARARWQIELLFKLWKQHGGIDKSRSRNPWRILCELYAKLLGMLIQHWLQLLSAWPHPDRSLVKAAATIRGNVALLIAALCGCLSLEVAIQHTCSTITLGCRMNTRRKRPNTYQLLLALGQEGLA
jgi:hypothetical protein